MQLETVKYNIGGWIVIPKNRNSFLSCCLASVTNIFIISLYCNQKYAHKQTSCITLSLTDWTHAKLCESWALRNPNSKILIASSSAARIYISCPFKVSQKSGTFYQQKEHLIIRINRNIIFYWTKRSIPAMALQVTKKTCRH